MRCAAFLIALGMGVGAWTPASAEAASAARSAVAAASYEVSAQTRPRARRRITVRPLRDVRDLRRECVPVFEERWIPQWGGRVLYASQRCWWTSTPAPPITAW